VRDRIHLLVLRIYRRLPTNVRRRLVRTISPSFTVGAMCFIERSDGAILLVRHSYRQRWGVPGGLLEKGEPAVDAVVREVREEVGVGVDLVGEPAVVVDAEAQRVDLVFRGNLEADGRTARPRSPEIVEARWFAVDDLPELQFETSQALVVLARSARSPQARPLDRAVSSSIRRSDAV
jgi:ADP-ribose pyrophosphatase YjhB (NUDIX family)